MAGIPQLPAPMVFRFVGDSLSNLADGYIGQTVSKLVSMLGPIALAGVTIFVSLYAILIMLGKISSPASDFIWKMFKIACVSTIALNAGNYQSFVMQPLQGFETGLVEAMAGNGDKASSTFEALDNALGKGNSIVVYCAAKSTEKSLNIAWVIAWNVAGMTVAAGVVLFVLVGGAMVVAAKFMLAILFGIGPLFVACLLFPVTAQFFDRWLSQVLTMVFTIVFITAAFGVGLQVFDALMTSVAASQWESPMFMSVQVLVITAVLAYVMYEAGKKASALGGGAATTAISFGQMAGFIASPAERAAQMINPTSNRLDPKTGLQTSSSRLEHLAMGRSFVSPNPSYRRAVMDQFRESMGRKNQVSGR